MLMKDKNGREMRTGDVVLISGAYFKSSNGLYFVCHAPGDEAWSGNSYSLHKIGKTGKISESKNSVQFWPLMSFVSNRKERWLADEHDEKQATIEVVDNVNMKHIEEYFIEKAREEDEFYQIHKRRWHDTETLQKTIRIRDEYMRYATRIHDKMERVA